MKPIRLLALSLVTTLTASAQTNTYPFPSSGNVGVGTTSPDATLHVNGGPTMTAGWNRTAVLQANYPVLGFNGVSNSWAGIGYDPGYAMRFWIGGTSNDIPGTSLLAMSINPAGNVGIGTSNPASKLDVVGGGVNLPGGTSTGTANTNPGVITHFNHADGKNYIRGTTIVADTGGNVGIGTISPAAKLDVLGEVWSTEALRCTRPALGLNNALGTDGSGGLVGTLSNHHLALWTNGANRVQITTTGNVGIGTIYPQHKLAVNGTIKAKEVIVETTGWSDYVFSDDYALQPLAEVEAHIKTNKHLPGIPSAAQVAEQGVSIGDMQARLLAKIEELTLHQIAQEKLLKAQTSQLAVQANELTALRAEVRVSRHP